MKLVILDAAQAELEEAQDYYLRHATPRIAATFANDYERSARRLLEYPLVGVSVSRDKRALPLRRFPYSIIYRIAGDTIVISAIAHQRRRPRYWRRR